MSDGIEWWADLSGAELRARLRQRGVDKDLAANLDLYRDRDWAARNITEVLGAEPGR